MKPFLAVSLAFVFGLAALADEPKADEVKKQAIGKALELFSGTWDVTSAKPEGVMKDARKLVFRKDRTYAALDRDGKELWPERSTSTRWRRRRSGTTARTSNGSKAATSWGSTNSTATP